MATTWCRSTLLSWCRACKLRSMHRCPCSCSRAAGSPHLLSWQHSSTRRDLPAHHPPSSAAAWQTFGSVDSSSGTGGSRHKECEPPARLLLGTWIDEGAGTQQYAAGHDRQEANTTPQAVLCHASALCYSCSPCCSLLLPLLKVVLWFLLLLLPVPHLLVDAVHIGTCLAEVPQLRCEPGELHCKPHTIQKQR